MATKPTSNQETKPQDSNADRRLDLLGVLLALLGVFTGWGILAPGNGRLLRFWENVISQGFGWGTYLLPLLLLGFGLWILVRRYDLDVQLTWERAVGISFLFLALQTGFHFFTFPENFQISQTLAKNGLGGGYLGALLLAPLQSLLGVGGSAIAISTWLLLSLSLTLDMPVLDLFRWFPPLFEKIKERGKAWVRKPERAEEKAASPAQPSKSTREPQKRTSLPSAAPALPEDQAVANWVLPHIPDILNTGEDVEPDEEYNQHRAKIIEETLESFGAPGHVVEINRGPTITQFGVEPDFIETRNKKRRVRVSKITRLSDDLALALAAKRIRMEAPVPGKGYIGVEVPNDEIALVALRDVIQSESFKKMRSPLKFGLGRDVSGHAYAADLTAMPHLLIAGTTGSGKSVSINALVACLLLHNTPEELRLIMVDPKRVELTGYDGIPHLLAPVVVDLERVVGVLQWVSREMDQRYHKFSQSGARNIKDYNRKMKREDKRKMPYLIVIIDELADLMMLAPTETEKAITRLAQLARATGIHLIISTQRPSTNVVTGLIKANFPARIAFATASGVDSRVIIDQPGAETLLGRGDMLFQAPDAAAPIRLQGVFVSDAEINRLVRYWRFLAAQIRAPRGETSAEGEPDARLPKVPLKQSELWEDMEEEDRDPLWEEAVEIIREQDRASISMLQRRLRIGYTRAARLIERMAEENIIGPPKDGPKARNVIDYGESEEE
ncbi:MAG: DNA translocase FtsK [Anaerolineales bacterium]|nr:DNA translocase FtsK [Anaerolineales bacterium]MBS3753135.1 DNA translocase FtsK [Anaerolineales bacterium]